MWGVISLVRCYSLTHPAGPKLTRDRSVKTIIFFGVKEVGKQNEERVGKCPQI